MGFKFIANHLTCPACDAAITPLNPTETDHLPVTSILAASFPNWDPEGVACEKCVNHAYESLTSTGLLSRIRSRLGGTTETRTIHGYRTAETI